jgi:SAM-dependent methyltransferase
MDERGRDRDANSGERDANAGGPAKFGTVPAALEDATVAGRTCLEAGAGAGHVTRALARKGARLVVAVTNDPGHARTTRMRTDKRVAVVEADLRATPLSAASVDLITAHGLFNLLTAGDAARVAAELTRVARPGAELIVDDYDPVPDTPGGRRARAVFAVENAATELADRRPALVFHPSAGLARLFEGHGWRLERERTLLEPVPWTRDLLETHAGIAGERARAADAPELVERADAALEAAGDGVETGRMYSLRFRLPG